MGFKKHNWVKYGRKGMKVEVKVLDEDNRTLDFFRWASSDKNTERRIGDLLKKKYQINLNPEIKPTDSINEMKSILKRDFGW